MTVRGRGSPTSNSATTRPGRGEHHHPVGEEDRLLDVVGHEQHGARLRVEHAGEPLLQVRTGDRVERAERLVEQQHRPSGQERAQERHPLAHPAGQFRRAGALELGEAEALEQRLGAPAGLGARNPLALEGSAALASASRQGSSRSRWGMYAQTARRSAALAAPSRARALVGILQAATSSSRVDLPQPDGPTTAVISSWRTRRSMPASAVRAP